LTVLVVMGVTGAGKTTIAARVAEQLGWRYQEGDALHPPANVAKMAGGTPLTDEDRWPWLAIIAEHIDQWRTEGASDVRLVFLRGSHELLATRLAERRGHFMPPALLDSQFATLEEPSDDERPIVVDVSEGPDDIVSGIVKRL